MSDAGMIMENSAHRSTWRIVSEVSAFAAPPYVSIKCQHVITDQGKDVRDFWQVELPDFVIAVALTPENEVLTLWQYKHGARRFGLSFPAGHIDPGETPEAAMRRELREETGYEAESTAYLGSYVVNANQGCGTGHLFLLTGCRKLYEPGHDDLELMELRLASVPEIDEAVRAGKAVALPHLAVWGAARLAMVQ